MKFQDTQETKDVAGAVFAEFLRIANPFIPFVTDHLAQALEICETLVLSPGVTTNDVSVPKEYETEVDEFINLIHAIRSEKQARGETSPEYLRLHEKLATYSDELAALAGLER